MSLTVIQALPALESGGVERGTVEVARELVSRGHRSIVISAGGRLTEQLQQEGSEHIGLPIGKKSPFTFRHVSHLRKIFMENRADIIHSRSRLPAWISWLAWKGTPHATRPRFVTTVHGPYSVNAYSKIMTRGERVIAISDFIKDYILSNYPETDPERITVIPRGVSPKEFPHGFKPRADWTENWNEKFAFLQQKFIVTLPARVTRWKGQGDFISIIAQLKTEGVPVHGLIAGGVEPKRDRFFQELKGQANKNGLSKDISFLGQRNDLREVMAISNVVLSLAREPEAFGRTALEALSLGVPVVAYDHGGAHEVLEAGFPLGLSPPLDISAAVAKIKTFYENMPPVPEQNTFTLERMLDNTMRLYEESVKP